jgi:hypothetical protein
MSSARWVTAVLAVQPRVLALDEPTTLLDLRHRDALLERLDALPQSRLFEQPPGELGPSSGGLVRDPEGQLDVFLGRGLLRVLNGLAEVTSGSARVHGTDAVHDVRAARRAVSWIDWWRCRDSPASSSSRPASSARRPEGSSATRRDSSTSQGAGPR